MSTDSGAGSTAAPTRLAPGAFGLAISSGSRLPGLETPAGVAGARRVDHRLVDAAALTARLGEGEPVRLLREGRGPLRVECHEHASRGLLIRTESFGDHLIADGGRTVLSAVAGAEPTLWQRYLLGQVLPVTASIQGLEVFHASAVAVEGGIVAIAGPSGAGKSSVAASLVASGAAAFFADDVLALEATAFELVAYPGPALLGIPLDQLVGVGDQLGEGPPWLIDGRKALVPIAGERRPLGVRAFLRLTPDESVDGVRFEPCLPDRLMASTFDGVSRGPERLLRLLRVAAMLAADGRAQELRYGPGVPPGAVAEALLARLDRSPAASGNGASAGYG